VLVTVFVEFWQIECCGDPPGIGDIVSWNLLAVPADAASPEPGDALLNAQW
jgi:hypothetical protein